MFPPAAASGHTCPMEAPLLAPLETSVRNSGRRFCPASFRPTRWSDSAFLSCPGRLSVFVANDHHISVVNITVVNSLNRFIFAVEYASRTGMLQHLRCDRTSFYYSAFRSHISKEDGQSAGFAVRVIDASNCVVVQNPLSVDILRYRVPVGADGGGIDQVLFCLVPPARLECRRHCSNRAYECRRQVPNGKGSA